MSAARRATVPSLAELMAGNDLRDSSLVRVLFGAEDESREQARTEHKPETASEVA